MDTLKVDIRVNPEVATKALRDTAKELLNIAEVIEGDDLAVFNIPDKVMIQISLIHLIGGDTERKAWDTVEEGLAEWIDFADADGSDLKQW